MPTHACKYFQKADCNIINSFVLRHKYGVHLNEIRVALSSINEHLVLFSVEETRL